VFDEVHDQSDDPTGSPIKQYSRVLPYTIYYQGPVLFEYDVNADGSGNPGWGLWIEVSNEMGTALGQNPGYGIESLSLEQ
jgi:hypothetical protein